MLLSVLVNIPLICVICLGTISLLLLLYYFALYGRFVFRKEKKPVPVDDLPPVSVVLTARDESHLLIKSLPVLLSQDYPNYEVVVVNDNSIDETADLINEFKNNYPNLHYVDLTSSISNIRGRKFPLALGIKAAKNEMVVLTDASSIPASPYWLQHLAGRFTRKVRVVFGGVSVVRKPGFLNALMRYDAVRNLIISFSYTLAGMPVMANGRNLAYTRTIFLKNKETFMAQPRMPYGDDDIFMNKVATSVACDVEPDPDALISQTGLTPSRWFQQKKAAFVTRSCYTTGGRILLKMYNFLSLLFYAALACTIVFCLKDFLLLGIGLGIAVLKIASQHFVFGKAAKKTNEKGLTPFLLFYDIVFALLNPCINFLSKFEKRKWR
ncbi:MAG: glycosyltransferase [Bacteroidales bacterium]|nr:glycosyltransferase [Bacteroidales bacterium]